MLQYIFYSGRFLQIPLRSNWIKCVIQRYRSFTLRLDRNTPLFESYALPSCKTIKRGICSQKPVGLLAFFVQRVISVNHSNIDTRVYAANKIFFIRSWLRTDALLARQLLIIHCIVNTTTYNPVYRYVYTSVYHTSSSFLWFIW